MHTPEVSSPVDSSDAELVAQSLLGGRDAFGGIVARYQTLVCSLAYNATGSLTQSEDLAQETFVTAWSQLSSLNEPSKLRPWLCGIARNLARRAWRAEIRKPRAGAVHLDVLDQLPATEPQPSEQAMSREEESILWRSLEGMPEIYREPLILYYRQNQSVDDVALALDLSAEAVRQRLVRGRTLLNERVLAFTEGALAKSSPGRRFTQCVLSALPLVAPSGKAAALGTTLAAGGSAAKGAAVLGGGLAMVSGALVSAQAEAALVKSERERKFVFRMATASAAISVVFYLVLTRSGIQWGPRFASQIEFAGGMFVFAALLSVLVDYRSRHQRRIQIDEGTITRTEWKAPEKRSIQEKLRLLAFPLIVGAVSFVSLLPINHRWMHDWTTTTLPTAIYLLLMATAWRLLGKLPRQTLLSAPQFRTLAPSVAILVSIGLVSLLRFNIMTLFPGGDPKVATAAQAIAFNLVVVLTYGLFAVVLARKHAQWQSLD